MGPWQLRVRESRGSWHACSCEDGEAKVWREGGEADGLRPGHLPCVDDFVGIICPAAVTSSHGCGALSEWIGAQCAESRRPPRVAVRPSSDGQAGRAACAMRSRNHRQFSIILPQFQFYNAPPRIVDRTSAQRSHGVRLPATGHPSPDDRRTLLSRATPLYS